MEQAIYVEDNRDVMMMDEVRYALLSVIGELKQLHSGLARINIVKSNVSTRY